MLKVLFQSIPSILFEPIAVGAVLGLVTAAVLFWRKKTAWYWSVTFALLFMISWRVAIQIVSSRYASILVFPATIATAYFAFKMDWLAGFIPRLPKWFCRSLPYLAIGGIAIGGFAQLLHYNPYANRIIQVAELIREDAKQYKSCHILAADVRRMQYYTGLPVSPILSGYISEAELPKHFAVSLQKGVGLFPDILYVVISSSAKTTPEYYLQALPDFIREELSFIGEFYHNRKKRQLTRIYRYNIKKAFDIVLDDKSNFMAVNRYVFDKYYSKEHKIYQHHDDYFKQRAAYMQSPLLRNLPVGWYAYWTDGFYHGSNGELGLVTDATGDRFFRMKSDAQISTENAQFLVAKPYRVKITLKGSPGSVLAIGASCFEKKWLGYVYLPDIEIIDRQLRSFTLSSKELLKGAERMRIAVKLFHGEIFIHSIELYEVEEEK